MYDLHWEDPEEPGLLDGRYKPPNSIRGSRPHEFQPQLLRETFRSASYSEDQIFTGSDLNLYYDVRHPLWHKRPDWFAVVGVDRFYQRRDLRTSYVIWQEEVNPLIVVELLSPGTEKEDLGENIRGAQTPPTKWEVYEQILKIPYYVVYDRYTNRLRAVRLANRRYVELELPQPRLWIEEIELELRVWQGTYKRVERQWLSWYDVRGNLILTANERAKLGEELVKQERQRVAQERRRAEQLAAQLRALGIEPDLREEED